MRMKNRVNIMKMRRVRALAEKIWKAAEILNVEPDYLLSFFIAAREGGFTDKIVKDPVTVLERLRTESPESIIKELQCNNG